MFFSRLRTLAEAVGFLAIGVLMVYGIISIFRNADSALGAPAESPAAVGASAPRLQGAVSETVPNYLNYQGILRDPEGNLMSGLHDMTFRLYDRVSAPQNEAVWIEQHDDVTVRDGQFSVLLGNTTALSLTFFYGPDTFIGVTVAPFDEMVPRQRFASVPYAIYADHASSLTSPNGALDEAVSVNATGNVGIGTQSPGYRLDVDGRMRVREGDDLATAGIWFANGNGQTDYGFVGMQSPQIIGLYGKAGARWGLVMNATSGFVGIGTTSPDVSLHVKKDDPDMTLVTNAANSAGATSLSFSEAGTPGAVIEYSPSADELTIKSQDVAAMTFSGANVGIGTANPTSKLHVSGDANVSGNLNFGSLSGFGLSNVFEAEGNNGSNDDITLISNAKSICFLTKTVIRNADDESEDVGCEVYEFGSNWKLRTLTSGDANAFCEVTCLRWD